MEVRENLEEAKWKANPSRSQQLALPTQKNALRYQNKRDDLAKYDFTADLESAGCEGIQPSKMERLCVRTFVLYRVQAGRRDVTYS